LTYAFHILFEEILIIFQNLQAIIFDQTNACHQNRLQSNNIFGGNPGGGGMFGGGGGYHGQKSSAGGSSLKGLSTPALLGLGGGGNDGAGGLPHQQDGYFS
jgi:hypothetical protein